MSEAEKEIVVYSGTVKPGNRFKDAIGQKFSRLLVVSRAPDRLDKNGPAGAMWNCQCDCGNRTVVSAKKLRFGSTKSCGCHRAEMLAARRTSHGCSVGGKLTAELATWSSMKRRCLNKNTQSYPRYGGKGITICERWLNSFADFLADMGLRPSPNHSIERKDNLGNYEPGNCKWATRKEQCRNRKNTVMLEIDGQRKSMVEWSESKGMNFNTLKNRINLGWDAKRAISEPIRKRTV